MFKLIPRLTKKHFDLNQPGNLSMFLKLATGIVIGIQLVIITIFPLFKPIVPPENIKVTNITNSSLTVSWTTKQPVNSSLIVSAESNRITRSLGFLLCELFSYRCRFIPNEIPGPSTTHIVNLKGIASDTPLYYRIYSGERLFKNDSYGKVLPSINTGPILNSPTLPNPVYSHVFRGDGKTPVINALVTITLVDSNNFKAKSSTITTYTDKKGLWIADLGNLRTPDFENSIPVTLGDRLSINISGQNGIYSTSYVEYSQKELKPIMVKKASL